MLSAGATTAVHLYPRVGVRVLLAAASGHTGVRSDHPVVESAARTSSSSGGTAELTKFARTRR